MSSFGNRKGAVLVLCYMVIALMIGIGSAPVIRSLTEQRAAQVNEENLAAVYLAEAALDEAITNMRDLNTDNIEETSLAGGTYWAEITPLSGSLYQVDAHGLSGASQKNIETIARVSGESVFKYALFGDDYIYMKKGSFTDSYDSSEGAYNAGTAGDEGDIGTNAISANSIEIKQNSEINGQLVVGPDIEDPEDAVNSDGSNIITGDPDVVSAASETSFPEVDVSGMSCSTNLSIGSGVTHTFTAAGSPYCYNSLSTAKNAVIRVSGGDVKVYVNTFDFNKSLDVNSNGNPTQFILQVYGTADIQIDKEGTFVGAIYSPEAQIRIKKAGNYYGSIVAESVYVDKESRFHYDAALAEIDDLSSGGEVEIESWREYEESE
jgi:hypothetical protein